MVAASTMSCEHTLLLPPFMPFMAANTGVSQLYQCYVFCGLQIAEHMSFDVTSMEYYPTIFFNEFWLLRDYLIPVNETVTEIPLHFTLSSMTLWKFTLFSQMDQAFSQQVPQCPSLLSVRQSHSDQRSVKCVGLHR